MKKRAKKKIGRPSKYKVAYNEQAYKLCLLGATDKDLADFFGVCEDTINEWKKKKAGFSESLKGAKKEADAKVVKSLYQRACGYEHSDIHFSSYEGDVTQTPHIKYYAPDTTACIFWLKNRDKENWKDRLSQELSGPDGGPLEIKIVDYAKIDDSK